MVEEVAGMTEQRARQEAQVTGAHAVEYVPAAANGPPWLGELTNALGWQGGTIHDALDAVRKLQDVVDAARATVGGNLTDAVEAERDAALARAERAEGTETQRGET